MNQVYLDKEYLMSVWNASYTENINKIKLYGGQFAELLPKLMF